MKKMFVDTQGIEGFQKMCAISPCLKEQTRSVGGCVERKTEGLEARESTCTSAWRE